MGTSEDASCRVASEDTLPPGTGILTSPSSSFAGFSAALEREDDIGRGLQVCCLLICTS